jgi:transcriptional regulator with XRE-family HTH domain
VTAKDHEFGAKLALTLQLLNISRGRLSAEVRVDKSLVSKWLRGHVMPSGHNLAALTDLVRMQRPRFTQLNWGLPLDAFTAALLSTPDGQAPSPYNIAPTTPGWFIPTRQQTAMEVAREGSAYSGVYVSFRQSLQNNGDIVPELTAIWRENSNLFFQQTDGLYAAHNGEIFVLRHQLFLAGAEHPRPDGIAASLYIGVTGAKAWRMHGFAMNVHSDRFGTPGVSPIVLQRVADLARPGVPPPLTSLSAVISAFAAAANERRLVDEIAPEILAAIRPVVGSRRSDGRIDHLMTIPAQHAMSVSEREWTEELERDVLRMRHLLFGERPCDDPEFPLRIDGRSDQ